ncbi:MAG: glycoside hydrolase family 95 protein [Acidobacteria bacterium]|nr:glycoside hydrolase family 95 protein [Acidobacteriota bacterium]
MIHSRRTFLALPAAVGLAAAPAPHNLRLWYQNAAADWNQAIPIGNGRMGAMIFGGVESDHLQLNENTLYSDEPGRRDIFLDIAKDRERVVTMLRNRQYEEAGEFITRNWGGRAQPCYQPMGDLHIHSSHSGATDYTRELDISTSLATVRYAHSGIIYTREYFASYPDQIIVIRLTASKPNSITFRAEFRSIHPNAVTREVGSSAIAMSGQVPGFALRRELKWVQQRNETKKYPEIFDMRGQVRPFGKPVLYGREIQGLGMKFDTHLRALNKGGTARVDNGKLEVTGATECVLLLSAGTSFNGFDKSPTKEGVDPAIRASADLKNASSKGYAALRASHTQDYQKLFQRVFIDLGKSVENQASLPTDERITAFANDQDPGLASLYFQFGRYLMISGSRPGGQPLNLQGIWNHEIIPPWASAYTTNINTEMNYWPAEVTNLSECHEPLFRMARELRVTGGKVAREVYKMRGWVEHHNTTIWRDAQPVDNNAMPAFWPMGGAWITQHLWEHWLFTGDRDFLEKEAYPAIKGVAEFCSDWLEDDGKGRLVTAAGNSPESTFRYTDSEGKPRTAGITMGPTMDMAIVREVFTNCIRASELLNRDPDLRNELKTKLGKLLPYQVGARGQLQEWPEDLMESDPHHRHISHLYPLHPGNQITKRGTPELFAAVRRTLELRGDEGTGWSRAWKINSWARMEDGNHAYQLVRNLLQLSKFNGTRYTGGGVMPNLLCSHPPFQIDGNFGGTAGIAEMLLQSHAGAVHLLPALPDAWNTGEVTGLCARGGFVVDLRWSSGKLTQCHVTSKLGKALAVRYGDKTVEISTTHGRRYQFDGQLRQS